MHRTLDYVRMCNLINNNSHVHLYRFPHLLWAEWEVNEYRKVFGRIGADVHEVMLKLSIPVDVVTVDCVICFYCFYSSVPIDSAFITRFILHVQSLPPWDISLIWDFLRLLGPFAYSPCLFLPFVISLDCHFPCLLFSVFIMAHVRYFPDFAYFFSVFRVLPARALRVILPVAVCNMRICVGNFS